MDDTQELAAFLRAIIKQGGAADRWELPLASRAQDRARQKAKRKGWATFGGGKWSITEAGLEHFNRKL